MPYQVPHEVKPVLVTIGWTVSTSAATLAALFQGLLLPQYRGGLLPELNAVTWTPVFYLGVFGISILAALVLADFGRALASLLASYVLAATIIYTVLALPGFTGAFPLKDVLVAAAVVFTFTAFFPFLLLVELFGTLLGTALSERLF